VDAVIAGASFAGLAVAQRLSPAGDGGVRVVLVDPHPVGEGVTSACAAPVRLVEAAGGSGAIQQVHHHLVIHIGGHHWRWPLPEPFCTFEYRLFCVLAQTQTSARCLRAAVLGRDGNMVRTTAGEVRARFLVDASGWRAVLAGPPRTRGWWAFGLETEVDGQAAPGLHFYFVPEVPDGYAWVFPCGGRVRVGVLSYRGRSALREPLVRFLARWGLRPRGFHGGFLAGGPDDPVREGVFVVGDAGGHCLPLTGEGIRTALLAGWRCGSVVREAVRGRLSVEEAQEAFRSFVLSARTPYRILRWMNQALLALPPSLVSAAAAGVGAGRLRDTWMRWYLGLWE
jgi:flavin-dependent dehydrogenase